MGTQKPAEKELLDGVVDRLLKDYKKPEDVIGENGLRACFTLGPGSAAHPVAILGRL